jgi:hypothetical protein
MEVTTLKAMSITLKWRTSKLLRWVHLLSRLLELDEIFYGGDANEGDHDAYFLVSYLQPFRNGGRLNF